MILEANATLKELEDLSKDPALYDLEVSEEETFKGYDDDGMPVYAKREWHVMKFQATPTPTGIHFESDSKRVLNMIERRLEKMRGE